MKKILSSLLISLPLLLMAACQPESSIWSSFSGQADKEAPSIFILNPTSEDVYVTTDHTIGISGTAQDNQGLKSVTYTTSTGANGTAEGLEEWSIPDIQLEEGDNLIEITATDLGRNQESARITITKNQYLTFLGVPFVSEDVLFINEEKELWITVTIAPNENLIDSSVKLIEVDADKKVIGDVCRMYDDGDLSKGDEIKGDNIFSILRSFSFDQEGTRYFRVSAQSLEEEGEVEAFSAVFSITVLDKIKAEEMVVGMLETQSLIEEKATDLSRSNLSTEQKKEAMTAWLNEIPSIKAIKSNGNAIEITHDSGLQSLVLFTDPDSRGGSPSTTLQTRAKAPRIPLEKQIRGLLEQQQIQQGAQTKALLFGGKDDTIIQNKNVLLWAPFENLGIPMMKSQVFHDSPVNLHVVSVSNLDCTVASLSDMTDYGIIVFDTHGSGGEYLFTRDPANFDDINDSRYKAYISGLLATGTVDSVSYYAVKSKYIRKSLGHLPNSIVFNASCESLKTNNLANAFIARGAKTYIGFKETVTNGTCDNKEQEFFSRLVGEELMTSGQAFTSDIDFQEVGETYCWLNSYLMRGSNDMHFHLGLINGDFEYGNLNGWNVSGDGRVITRLGPQLPAQRFYMGIVSTGLGFTEDYGCISQTFRVAQEKTLSIRWNFLSEEFLEYVGSEFQDYLRITLRDGSSSYTVYANAIDGFANDYSLSYVSPSIVFDQGDVYQTGWQTSTYNISKFKGKSITLSIECGDIGDSIYDSVVLIDDIKIE